MYKKMLSLVSACLFCLVMSPPFSNAEDFVINNYLFTWHVAKAGSVEMDIQKENGRLAVLLHSPGGKLATLYLSPSEAKAVGEMLGETEQYYNKHKQSDKSVNEDTIEAGQIRVTFASSYQAKKFEIRVTRKRFLSATVLMFKDQAIKIREYLLKAPEMADFVHSVIKI